MFLRHDEREWYPVAVVEIHAAVGSDVSSQSHLNLTALHRYHRLSGHVVGLSLRTIVHSAAVVLPAAASIGSGHLTLGMEYVHYALIFHREVGVVEYCLASLPICLVRVRQRTE